MTYPTNMYITADVVERCNKLFPDVRRLLPQRDP